MKRKVVIQEEFGQFIVESLAKYAGHHTEAFGSDIIEKFAAFARHDLESPDQLEKELFNHIDEAALRQAMAQVLYGSRWLYKLGLALLVQGGTAERAAHIRAQIVDYASIVEALLSYCNTRAIDDGYTIGSGYQWIDPDRRTSPINWNRGSASTSPILRKLSYWWHARISHEFKIIKPQLYKSIDELRLDRNTVHVRELVTVGRTSYLNQSARAFGTLLEVVEQTKDWCNSNPRTSARPHPKTKSRKASFLRTRGHR